MAVLLRGDALRRESCGSQRTDGSRDEARMNESTIDVVVLGVMHQRTDLGHTKAWVDVARSDGDERDYVSVPLPASDYGLSRALKLAGRRQMRLRVPVTFFDDAGDGRLMALRDALQEE